MAGGSVGRLGPHVPGIEQGFRGPLNRWSPHRHSITTIGQTVSRETGAASGAAGELVVCLVLCKGWVSKEQMNIGRLSWMLPRGLQRRLHSASKPDCQVIPYVDRWCPASSLAGWPAIEITVGRHAAGQPSSTSIEVITGGQPTATHIALPIRDANEYCALNTGSSRVGQ